MRNEKDPLLLSIENKLKLGEALSKKELNFIEQTDLIFLKHIQDISHEAEQYKKSLSHVKNEEQFQTLSTNLLQKLSTKIDVIQHQSDAEKKYKEMEELQHLVVTLLLEHNLFMQSDKFKKLPTKDMKLYASAKIAPTPKGKKLPAKAQTLDLKGFDKLHERAVLVKQAQEEAEAAAAEEEARLSATTEEDTTEIEQAAQFESMKMHVTQSLNHSIQTVSKTEEIEQEQHTFLTTTSLLSDIKIDKKG